MDGVLTLDQVSRLTGLDERALNTEMAACQFPQSVELTGGVRAWREHDVAEWLESNPRAAQALQFDPSIPGVSDGASMAQGATMTKALPASAPISSPVPRVTSVKAAPSRVVGARVRSRLEQANDQAAALLRRHRR